MISLRDVSFSHDGAAAPLLRSISLEVGDGERVALAGGNGSGKSTLCRLIAGLAAPASGAVSVDGEDPRAVRARGGAPPVGIAFQHPDSQFVTTGVAREILFGMENRRFEAGAMRERLGDALRSFALSSFALRNPHTLSGGEQQRLLLASLWAMAPRHLVVDEPCSFLDEAGRRAFLDALDRSFGPPRTVVWATVEAAEAALATRVLFLRDGAIRYDGPPAGLGAAVPRETLDAALAGPFPDPPRAGGAAGPAGSKPLVSIRNAVFSPGGAFSIAVPLLDVARGETVGIAGPSGSGKTTLLLACAGLIPPRAGEATVLGARIRSRRDAPVGRCAVLFQAPEEGFFAPTVLEEVALAHRSFRGEEGAAGAAAAALESVGLPPATFGGRSPFRLSQGEKRLVALASILVLRPELLLLDEPTIFLDGAARARLLGAVGRLRAEGSTLVVSSHDRRFLASIGARVVATA